MRFPVAWSLLFFLAGSWGSLAPAHGEKAKGLERVVLSGEFSQAFPLSQPLRSRFGVGIMPSISATIPIGDILRTGLRLRYGLFMDGPPPRNPGVKDPGMGDFFAGLAIARVRPMAKAHPPNHLTGLLIELGLGVGRTGRLVRMAGEAALGWEFPLGAITLGPTFRYLQMAEKNFSLKGNDAKLLLFGIELSYGRATKGESKTVVSIEKSSNSPTDTDGDQIPDLNDKCPTESEDIDGFEDDNGCPDLDNDRDGLTDVVDKCPNQPENMNGTDDLDGCPEAMSTAVKEERLSYEEHVLFDFNSARIRPEAQPILWAIVTLWKQHPEWDRLVIEGHADQQGSEEYNNWLSQERALQTRAVLIAMGFPAEKIEVAGYGNRLPLKPGHDENAFKENRRVELIIIPRKTNAAGVVPPPANGGRP